uniref:Potassium channel domain-containing protein n=1 Tax=Romanomermis culicivorax TaxID=13658 RepID=A0A915KMN3_ROMCU
MKTSFLNIKPTTPGGQRGHSSRRGSRRRAAAIPTTDDSELLKKQCEIKYETTTSDEDNGDDADGRDSANLLYIKSVHEVEEPKISARLQAFIEPIWEGFLLSPGWDAHPYSDVDQWWDSSWATQEALLPCHQTRIIVPHIGIMCLSILYIISGAAAFYAIEGPFEIASLHQNCLSIKNLTADSLNSFWYAIGRKVDTPGEVYVSTEDAVSILDRMSRHLLDIFDRDQYMILERLGGQTIQEIRCENIPNQMVKEWTSSTALFFATTMLTTIGYGNLAPATPLGRLVCCIYGLLGIPLLLVTTANCGSFI